MGIHWGVVILCVAVASTDCLGLEVSPLDKKTTVYGYLGEPITMSATLNPGSTPLLVIRWFKNPGPNEERVYSHVVGGRMDDSGPMQGRVTLDYSNATSPGYVNLTVNRLDEADVGSWYIQYRLELLENPSQTTHTVFYNLTRAVSGLGQTEVSSTAVKSRKELDKFRYKCIINGSRPEAECKLKVVNTTIKELSELPTKYIAAESSVTKLNQSMSNSMLVYMLDGSDAVFQRKLSGSVTIQVEAVVSGKVVVSNTYTIQLELSAVSENLSVIILVVIVVLVLIAVIIGVVVFMHKKKKMETKHKVSQDAQQGEVMITEKA